MGSGLLNVEYDMTIYELIFTRFLSSARTGRKYVEVATALQPW